MKINNKQTTKSKLVYKCPDCEKSMLNDKDTIQLHKNKFCKKPKKK